MRALALIHSAFPIILGHGGLELRARAYITEAKCHLADKKFSGFLLYLLHLPLRYCTYYEQNSYTTLWWSIGFIYGLRKLVY